MENFEKLSAPTLKELFINKMAELILSGKLKVGERLPPERSLAEQMGIGKTVVHSGLQELARMGFVTIKPQSGVYIADYMVTGNLETFSAVAKYSGYNISPEIIRGMYDMRYAMEGLAMERFARQHTAEDIKTLREMIVGICNYVASEDMNYTGLAERFFDFHHMLSLLSRSAIIPLTFNAVKDVSIVLWEKYLRSHSPGKAIDRLTYFVDCFEAGDGEAACLVFSVWAHGFDADGKILWDREPEFESQQTAIPRYLTDVQEDGRALQFDGARKRYLLTEEFAEDKPNGYSKFKVFWLKRKKK